MEIRNPLLLAVIKNNKQTFCSLVIVVFGPDQPSHSFYFSALGPNLGFFIFQSSTSILSFDVNFCALSGDSSLQHFTFAKVINFNYHSISHYEDVELLLSHWRHDIFLL